MEDWITSPPPKKKNVAHVPIPRLWVDYFLGGPVVKSACQRRRHRRHIFDPSVGKIPWRRKWQPIPVFLPGKSHGQRSLVGYSPWDHKRVRHDWTCEGWMDGWMDWKKMSSRTFIAREEKSVPGFKASKERLTLLLLLSHFSRVRLCVTP